MIAPIILTAGMVVVFGSSSIVVHGFSTSITTSKGKGMCFHHPRNNIITLPRLSSKEDDEDWFEDFEDFVNDSSNGISSSKEKRVLNVNSQNDDDNNIDDLNQPRKRRQRPPRSKKDFGPEGHDYKLADDAGPSISSFSEDKINSLIAERLQYKLNGEYSSADAIYEELFENNVVIYDKKQVWRADGQTFSDDNGGQQQPRRSRGQYVKSEYSSPIEDEELIQKLLDERSKYKASRIYKKADEIRDGLISQYNVYIDDKVQEWSVGGNFGHRQQLLTVKKKQNRFSEMIMAPNSPTVPNDDFIKKIQELVNTRDAARGDRDFITADQIKEDLLDRYNVYLNDKYRQWSVGRPDSIVEVDDEQNNNNDTEGRKMRRRPQQGNNNDEPPPLYRRRGGLGSRLTREDEQVINDLILQRDDAKQERDYKVADDIRDRIRNEYTVYIDDRNQEWYIISNEYTASKFSVPCPSVQQEIEQLVAQRAEARDTRNYDLSDEIRDTLLQRYQVSIDDRIKEWTKLDEEQYDYYLNNNSVATTKTKDDNKKEDKELNNRLDDLFGDDSDDDAIEKKEIREEESIQQQVPEEVVVSDDAAADDKQSSDEEMTIKRDELLKLTVPELK
eukprot:CAMPEP_0194172406 /NCGR_PEP_ID=MMETSP0154-20130528/6899_1 /TAXON_ID=1049557 /ORGANISM="Thalassiothrix antarctica, Strain L6-D1" /LENGTH=615 /DNA_ID=CAMNT_0038885079 /DNA_START=87 /DNA_END=1931 /DNA_ORIENTATION=-